MTDIISPNTVCTLLMSSGATTTCIVLNTVRATEFSDVSYRVWYQDGDKAVTVTGVPRDALILEDDQS